MDNKKLITFKRSERGQAATEFALISPLIFGMFMIMIIAGLTWHGHHLTLQLATEGASREGVSAGAGVGRILNIANKWMPGYQISASTSQGVYPAGISGKYVTVRTQGITPAWSILGIRAGVGSTSAGTVSPVWEFIP